MKRMKTLLRTRRAVLAALLLSCGASLAQATPAAPASVVVDSAPPVPAVEVIRVAWDRVGTEA